MLHNLFVEITGNATLIVVWEGQNAEAFVWTLIVEDPVDGTPCVVSRTSRGVLRSCLREAWDFIVVSDTFRVLAHSASADSITDVWVRDFGAHFARVADAVGTKAVQVSGVAYRIWGNRIKESA